MLLFSLQYGVSDVFERCPAIFDIEAELLSEVFCISSVSAANFVGIALRIASLDECKAHFFNASEETLDSPSTELGSVVRNFLCEADRSVLIKIFAPLLALIAPFRKHKDVQLFVIPFHVTVNSGSDTNLKFGAQPVNIIVVTKVANNLILIL